MEAANSTATLDDGLPALVPNAPFEALGDEEIRAIIEEIREERLDR